MSRNFVAREELNLASRSIGDGLLQTELSVPAVKCASCIKKIENGLASSPGVVQARVNLSTKSVTIDWRENHGAPPLIEILNEIGFEAYLRAGGSRGPDHELRRLIRALAVAGFGAANIMMLSVGVWAGADAGARALFHGLSALIALPVMIYSGGVFFSSAWAALRSGRTNMDVPISVGVLITFAMSAYDTATGGPHAYFDAVTSLIFFLLIGRTLDRIVRSRAYSAIAGLQKLVPECAAVIQPDGVVNHVPLDAICPGMLLRIPAGGRVPIDGTIVEGQSDIDDSVINGESALRPAGAGDKVLAGALNITGPLAIRVTSSSSASFVSEMVRLMERVETTRHGYQRITDRVSQLYTPVVHLGALLALIIWLLVDGNVHQALSIAVSVLIITCPCALGLAVPMVQVITAQRLYRNGVLIKDGAALERLSEIDTVLFDKTGTLTEGTPALVNDGAFDDESLGIASAVAAYSLHPYSNALTQAARHLPLPAVQVDQIAEYPGDGIEAVVTGRAYRLGRPGWATSDSKQFGQDRHSSVVLGLNGRAIASFNFIDRLRPSAREVVTSLIRSGISVEILSGDREGAVATLSEQLGGVPFSAALRPEGKLARISELARQGRRVVMVGDGVNDVPALAAAHASIAPGNAADIGRTAADVVFLNNDLDVVTRIISSAKRAKHLMRQNIYLAVVYNALAVPLAFFGFVTPIVAAIAMSASSIIVVLNSLRIGLKQHGIKKGLQQTPLASPVQFREAL